MLLRRFQNTLPEAGLDEAGRGCLAGPVVAAAVILHPKKIIRGLNDSKQLTEAKRNQLRPIIESKALAWAIGIADPAEIDSINILHASFLAMHRAVEKLKTVPGLLLVDGNRFNPYPGISHTCIIEGDGKYQSIAAASILAKTYRDDLMANLHEKFPHYHWKNNKGYPTRAHREAIKIFGPSAHHRQSFTLLPSETEILEMNNREAVIQ